MDEENEIQYIEGIKNEDDEIMELYIPRKCSYTNRILSAKDKASI